MRLSVEPGGKYLVHFYCRVIDSDLSSLPYALNKMGVFVGPRTVLLVLAITTWNTHIIPFSLRVRRHNERFR